MSEHAPPENANAARQGGIALQSDEAKKSHGHAIRTSQKRPHGGYFRVSEEAIRLIHNSFDAPSAVRNATTIYITFCRKANLRGSTTFEDRLTSAAAVKVGA